MKRRKEREFALQILYALELNESSAPEQIDMLDKDLRKHETTFARQLIDTCIHHKAELDEQIKGHLINWDFVRVAIIDRLLLRMSLAEFIHFEDVPPEVTMNEYIEIGKNYSTEQSGKFLNGILDAVLRELRMDNQIHKSGRGLVSKIK